MAASSWLPPRDPRALRSPSTSTSHPRNNPPRPPSRSPPAQLDIVTDPERAAASRDSSPALWTPTSSSSSGAGTFEKKWQTPDDDQSPRRQTPSAAVAPVTSTSERVSFDLGHDHDPDPNDPANMASFVGQPAIRGSSEAVRMVLLTFVTIGITYVTPTASLCMRNALEAFTDTSYSFTWGIEMTCSFTQHNPRQSDPIANETRQTALPTSSTSASQRATLPSCGSPVHCPALSCSPSWASSPTRASRNGAGGGP